MAEQKITVGGREFTLLPIPAIGLKAIGQNFAQLGALTNEGIDVLVDAIYYGVKRSAPDDACITRVFFEWNIDVTNVQELTAAVAAVNALQPAAETAPGEAPAGN